MAGFWEKVYKLMCCLFDNFNVYYPYDNWIE